MKKIMILLLAVFLSSMAWAQTATVQPKIMVIPYTKQGEDISQVIENDVNKRIVLAKIREAFDSRGFTTVDFAAKLKSLSRTSGLSQESQSDLKSMIIQQSGADIYVEAEMDIVLSSTGNSVKTYLQRMIFQLVALSQIRWEKVANSTLKILVNLEQRLLKKLLMNSLILFK